MQATQAMLDSIRQAVKALEDSWDAQRDFEMEVGRDFDGLSDVIADWAVIGAESVDLEMVQEYLNESVDEKENEQ